MLDVSCIRCGEPMTQPGALVFSSPLHPNLDTTKKWHVGVCCETALIKFLCGFPNEGIETNERPGV